MNRAVPGTIAILWRGDRTTRREATPHNNRFHRIFEELARLGLRAEPAVYDETFADEVRAQLLRADGVLVWVNPLQDGKTRRSLSSSSMVGQQMAVSFGIKLDDSLVNGAVEVIRAGEGLMSEVMPLQVAPDPFN